MSSTNYNSSWFESRRMLMSEFTRKREIDFKSGTYVSRFTNALGGSGVSTGDWGVKGRQETTSGISGWGVRAHILRSIRESEKKHGYNPKLNEVRKLVNRQDFGTGFISFKHGFYKPADQFSVSVSGSTAPGGTQYWFTAPQFANGAHQIGPTSNRWPPLSKVTTSAMITAGSTAISMVNPGNPASDAATFLGELREGLPKYIGRSFVSKATRGQTLQNVGGEYLNYQFGIVPVISDVSKFVSATINADKHLKQLVRDSGRIIRRRYDFPEVTSTEVTTTVGVPVAPAGPSYCYTSNSGVRTKTRVTYSRIWFSGSFTYHLPKEFDSFGEMAGNAYRLQKLYGVLGGPSTVWNLLPWSWAIDWESNVGNVYKNASAFNTLPGLVMPWGYVMCHQVVTDTYTLDGIASKSGDAVGQISESFVSEYKVRIRSTPFGFGLNWDGFTPAQSAILGALGMTKFPRMKR